MARQKVRFAGHPARPLGSLLAVSLCLAIGLLLLQTGTALGISGFASNEPAVRAQYPDATYPDSAGPQAPGTQPVVSSLADIGHVTREAERNPKVAARLQASRPEITRMALAALSSAAGLGTSQSGSIALLIAGIVVLSVGSALRWRRGLTQIQ
jgi:hypothetical protein